MPTYDYECDACGHTFELFQSIKEASLKKCPQCKKQKVTRMLSGGSGVIFKGSGFYQTDYRSEGYKKAAESEKKAVEGNKSSTEGTEAKKKKEVTEKKEKGQKKKDRE